MLTNILEEVILLLGLMLIVFFFLIILFIIGLIFLLIGFFKKDLKHKKIILTIGFILIAPICFLFLYGLFNEVSDKIHYNQNLNYQVFYGDSKDVEAILKKGISPECFSGNKKENILAKDGEETTIYYLCSSNNIEEAVEKLNLLIEYGGDVNRITFKCDKTPEEHISLGYNDGCGTTPLMEACYNGNIEMVKALLENGANVNAREFSGRTALHHAVFYDTFESNDETQLEIIKILLDNGIDKNIEGYYHGTALDCAQEYGLTDFMVLLSSE